jgi:DNA-binding transcriptional regulator YiaG
VTVEELAEVVRVRRMCASGEAARIRHRARVSQTELAATVGVPPGTVGAWERGENMPGPDAAREYGRVLDVIARAAGLDEVERTLPLFDPPRKAGA